MTWGLKRQIFYIVILIIFFGIFTFLIIYPSINKAPTCTDGRQNGFKQEDCEALVPRLVFEVTLYLLFGLEVLVVPGRYNAVAYLENHNKISSK